MALYKIVYKGLSDIRHITKKDAKQHGVELDGDLTWEPYNRHTIHVDGLSDALLDVLRAEGTFTVTEVSDKAEVNSKEIITGKAIDDTGNTVKDATSGQVSKQR